MGLGRKIRYVIWYIIDKIKYLIAYVAAVIGIWFIMEAIEELIIDYFDLMYLINISVAWKISIGVVLLFLALWFGISQKKIKQMAAPVR